MRLIRVHVPTVALAPGARVELAGRGARNTSRACCGSGPATRSRSSMATVSITLPESMHYGRARSRSPCSGRAAARAESPLSLTLVQGIARSERMDLVVQKATELGVTAIQPVRHRAQRREARRRDAREKTRALARHRDRGLRTMRARAPARARRTARRSRMARSSPRPPARCASAARARRRAHRWSQTATGARVALLLVGPEGGLEESERDAALAVGYLACRLGPRVLRSETAAVAALSVLQAVAGDLN